MFTPHRVKVLSHRLRNHENVHAGKRAREMSPIAWPDADRRSRLVFIVDGLDRGLIERSLRAFLRLGSSALSPAAA
jgi:hypothetical protein